MKASYGVPDLGCFIDRTIKQCLEYDLEVSDTDAVLADMAKTWPAEEGQGQRSQHQHREEGRNDLQSGNDTRESERTDGTCYRLNAVESRSCNGSNCNNNSYYSGSSVVFNNNNNNNNNPAVVYRRDSYGPNTNGTDGNISKTTTTTTTTSPSLQLSSPRSARSKNPGYLNVTTDLLKEVGDANGDGDPRDPRDPSDHDLKRSNSCEELMSLEMPVRRGLEGSQASPSPEVTSASPTSCRPAKLKSRLQLRYLEDEEVKVTSPRGGRFSETMDANFSGNSASGSPAFSDTDIEVERESPIDGAALHKQDALVSEARPSGRDRKRQVGVVTHENEIVVPKKVRREEPVHFSRQQRDVSQRVSPIEPPQQEDYAMREEVARYPPLARLNSNEEMGPAVNLPGLLRQGLDFVRISGVLRHPQVLDPSQPRSNFLPTAPPHLNGAVPIRPREISSLEANSISRHGELRPERQQHQNRVSVDPRTPPPPPTQQQQQLPHQHSDLCECRGCVAQQQQRRHQHQHHQQQPQYHHPKPQRHQDRIASREDDDKNSLSLKNPMYRIASIIAEELQKDDENGFDENRAVCRRANPDRRLWGKRCTNVNCSSQSHNVGVPSRSPPSADLAPRRGLPQYSPNGSISRHSPETRPQANGVEPHLQVNGRHSQHPQGALQRVRQQFSEGYHHVDYSLRKMFFPEHNHYYDSRGLHREEATRSNPSQPRERPLDPKVGHHQGSSHNLEPMRDTHNQLVQSHAHVSLGVSVSSRPAPVSSSSRLPAPHQPSAVTLPQIPPPSHQPRLSHAHIAPFPQNILLPSHHPMSHLSTTRVPVYNGEVPSEDQPQDLSNKGKSATSGYTNATKDTPITAHTHINKAVSPNRGTLNSNPNSFSAYGKSPPGNPSSLDIFNAQPLNLTIKDRLKRGFYSTPSSPELRGAGAASGRCEGGKCPPGRSTP